MPKLAVVSCTMDPERAAPFWRSWRTNADGDYHFFPWYETTPRGTVAPFHEAIETVCLANTEVEVIAAFHDDLRIDRKGWDTALLDFFKRHPKAGLVGFGGALGVGRVGMYTDPYDPMSLARHDFRSNMDQAEAHGVRIYAPERVAVLDGFSLVGRKDLMLKSWRKLRALGIVHHAYDVAVGCMAKREGLETWVLPLACHHHGGLTAVGDPRYQEWAKGEFSAGDQTVWEQAHRAVWEEFKDVLPFWAEGEEEKGR